MADDDDRVECDRCGRTIGQLEPVTNIQFSGGVDALRTACLDCIQEITEVWNEGEAV
jgi:C4-type Zn-finger protein